MSPEKSLDKPSQLIESFHLDGEQLAIRQNNNDNTFTVFTTDHTGNESIIFITSDRSRAEKILELLTQIKKREIELHKLKKEALKELRESVGLPATGSIFINDDSTVFNKQLTELLTTSENINPIEEI